MGVNDDDALAAGERSSVGRSATLATWRSQQNVLGLVGPISSGRCRIEGMGTLGYFHFPSLPPSLLFPLIPFHFPSFPFLSLSFCPLKSGLLQIQVEIWGAM